ncbi:MAG: ROK family protein [Terriglobales bacterium]
MLPTKTNASANPASIALGVDIGGTKVASGLVNSRGEILFKTRVPMKATGTAEEAMQSVHEAIRGALNEEFKNGRQVTAIGVASPGPLDLPAGIVLQTPNLPCWQNFPLGDRVRREYGLPVFVDNDANAAGLAEARWGAGAGFNSVFYATIGTGIGTAIVLNQRLYYGRTGTAAEGGHITIDYRGPCHCGCGKRGCVESIASGTGIARRARECVQSVAASPLLAMAGGDPAAITAETVTRGWRTGDPLSTEIICETMHALTAWFGNIVDLLEPDVIVVGGGLGAVVGEWFEYIREHLPEWSINSRCQEIPFVQAKYGVDAGIAGAAALCFPIG